MKISDLVAAAIVSGIFSVCVAYVQTKPLSEETPGTLSDGALGVCLADVLTFERE